MSLPFLNTAPGYDEALRNSVFFERGLHATSICGAVGAAVAVAMLQGQDEAGIASAAGVRAYFGSVSPALFTQLSHLCGLGERTLARERAMWREMTQPSGTL